MLGKWDFVAIGMFLVVCCMVAFFGYIAGSQDICTNLDGKLVKLNDMGFREMTCVAEADDLLMMECCECNTYKPEFEVISNFSLE